MYLQSVTKTRFTSAHLCPLWAHVNNNWTPVTLTRSGPMTSEERACVQAGLLNAVGFTTTITPAGIALLQIADDLADD